MHIVVKKKTSRKHLDFQYNFFVSTTFKTSLNELFDRFIDEVDRFFFEIVLIFIIDQLNKSCDFVNLFIDSQILNFVF